MNKFTLIIIALFVGLAGYYVASHRDIGPVPQVSSGPTPPAAADGLPQVYENDAMGIELRFPALVASTSEGLSNAYKADESYVYQISPTKIIPGVKFTIPLDHATGTNLSNDSYLSVETFGLPGECDAVLFLDGKHDSLPLSEEGVNYLVATSSNAGAGNRYEETVYAIEGTDPCLAVRYLIHHTVVENYPAGAVSEFDRAALLSEFDKIRRSLKLVR